MIGKFFMIAASLLLAFTSSFADPDVKDITLTTTDDVMIRATLSKPENSSGALAAIVLIHQGGSNRTEWASITETLVEQGYIVLAYDVRGHGDSDRVDSIRKLFNDPDLAPRDLQAALGYLREQSDVNNERLAVVGASIGANLAALASSEMDIKTAVAISGKTSAIYNLSGKDSLAMQSVFYIASAGDQQGKRAQWAVELFEQTAEPHQVKIVENSNEHGVGIFEDSPETLAQMLKWLSSTL